MKLRHAMSFANEADEHLQDGFIRDGASVFFQEWSKLLSDVGEHNGST